MMANRCVAQFVFTEQITARSYPYGNLFLYVILDVIPVGE